MNAYAEPGPPATSLASRDSAAGACHRASLCNDIPNREEELPACRRRKSERGSTYSLHHRTAVHHHRHRDDHQHGPGTPQGGSQPKLAATPGEVISAEVVRKADQTGMDHHVGPETGNYHPALEYTYTVDGRKYDGHILTMAVYSTASDDVRELMRPYPAGARVEVYYNPEDPSEATLITGENRFGSIFMIALSGCFVFVGTVVTVIVVLVLIARGLSS